MNYNYPMEPIEHIVMRPSMAHQMDIWTIQTILTPLQEGYIIIQITLGLVLLVGRNSVI